MAKNCINPKCDKEIPTSAVFCNFCGTQQVDNENLTEEGKLRKELSEQQETIALLKKALTDAQKNSDSSAKNMQKIEKLQKQLDELLKFEKKKDTEPPNTQPKPPINRNPNKKWIGWLLFGLVVFAILIVWIVNMQKNTPSEELILTEEIETEPVIEIPDSKPEQNKIDRQKIEDFIQKYSQYTVNNNFQGLRELYAPTVERYHNAYNKDREYVIDCYKRYDKKFKVYGKHSSIRWNTLEIKQKGNLFVIVYIEDYSVDRYDATKDKYFVLEKHIELDENYQIVSVYDVQISKRK